MIRSGLTSPAGIRGRSALVLTGLAIAGVATGILLTLIGSRFDTAGPFLVFGLPALGLLIAAAFTRPLIGVAAIVVAFPFGTVAVLTEPLSIQAVELAVVMVAVVVALHRLSRGITMLPWVPQLGWMLALIVWTLVALPSAIDQELALKQIAQVMGGLLYASCVIAACRDLKDVRQLMTLFAIVAAGVSLYALVNPEQMQVAYGGATVSGRAQGTFVQPNELGSFLALAAVTAIGLAIGARRWSERMGFIGILVTATGALLLSLSRGAWIGTTAGIAFLALTLRGSRRLILGVSIPVLAVAAITGALASSTPQVEVVTQRIEVLTVLSPYDDRPSIWAEAVREIRLDPWTGQGPGSFPVASARSSSEATTASAKHAHNLWLTWAAESGLPAVLLLIGFMVALGIGTRQALAATAQPGERALLVGLAAALITVAGQGIVDYTLRNAVVFFSVWTVIGALLASWRILTSTPPSPASTEPSRIGP